MTGSIGGDELSRLVVDAPFLLQRRGKEEVDPVSLRGRGNSLEFPERKLLATSSEAARVKLGWLNFLDRLKRGMLSRT